jgi:hypothetical protein
MVADYENGIIIVDHQEFFGEPKNFSIEEREDIDKLSELFKTKKDEISSN